MALIEVSISDFFSNIKILSVTVYSGYRKFFIYSTSKNCELPLLVAQMAYEHTRAINMRVMDHVNHVFTKEKRTRFEYNLMQKKY